MRAFEHRGSTIAFHSSAESLPSTLTWLSRMRPTISMLIMATTSDILTPPLGVRVKYVEPSTPDSSPENDMKTMSRRSSPFRSASARAASISAAVPEPLSSAPR